MYQPQKWMLFSKTRVTYPASLFLSVILLLLLLTLSGCSGIPISYYDATTYTQLTALKAETTSLVESFDTKPISDNKDNIDKVTLSFKKAYEYEFGKGKPNSDTTTQLDKIMKLYFEDIKNYLEYGPGSIDLGKKYFSEASVALGQAFDIAISTENLKNKDKR